MKTITSDMTLKDIVNEAPGAGNIFRELRIDFIHNGDKTLSEVTAGKNLSLENLIYEINELDPVNEDGIDLKYMDEKSVLTYIQRKYHEDLKDELPVLEEYLEQAVKQNKKRQSELEEVEELFKNIKTTFLEHIDNEDNTVFELLSTYLDAPNSHHFEAVKPHMTSLKSEHENLAKNFYELRALTNDYTLDSGATAELRLVYRRLEKLEKDAFNHFYLENNKLIEGIYEKQKTMSDF